MVTPQMIQLAEMWVQACKEARVKSGEVYWSESNADGDYNITAFDQEGKLWQVYGGGDDE